jgi:sulfite exporter TauE/SafE
LLYLLPFFGGLAASLHCVGMCGPFALALGAGTHRVWRGVLYNLGRVGTLLGLGAMSGALGAAVVASGPTAVAGRVLAIVAGCCMLVIALETLGVASVVGPRLAALAQATVGRALGGVLRSRSAAAPLAFGAFNALLPCHLIYAFAAQAASTASALHGAAVMAAFGLGTVPAMLGLGVAGAWFAPHQRQRLSRVAGVLVLAFALLTIGRGLGLLPDHAANGQHDGGHHQLDHGEGHGGAE